MNILCTVRILVYRIFHSNFRHYTQVTSHSEQLLQVKDLKEEVLHQFEELIEKKAKVLHSDSHDIVLLHTFCGTEHL